MKLLNLLFTKIGKEILSNMPINYLKIQLINFLKKFRIAIRDLSILQNLSKNMTQKMNQNFLENFFSSLTQGINQCR